MKLLLATILVLAPFSLIAAEPERSREQALEAIKKYDGRVTNDDKAAGDSVTEVHFGCHSDITDDVLAQLRVFPNLHTVDLISDKITDEGLKYFHQMPKLQTLCLNSKAITDKGLENLKGLKLKVLLLMRCQYTDRGMNDLKWLPELVELRLWRMPVNDKTIAKLKEFKCLEKICLGQMHWDNDRQPEELRKALPQLEIHENELPNPPLRR